MRRFGPCVNKILSITSAGEKGEPLKCLNFECFKYILKALVMKMASIWQNGDDDDVE